eukprot:TRINITY_DN34334_c0_g1_i1.p1 TRINITY_DN34334_c0_g1~~TRINITY_DN34334_c0_g1_i1.p1  ORF type:complete len:458 (+),score=57.58 TRINITY_DN34334_c0_g1_i1:84-1457(+)
MTGACRMRCCLTSLCGKMAIVCALISLWQAWKYSYSVSTDADNFANEVTYSGTSSSSVLSTTVSTGHLQSQVVAGESAALDRDRATLAAAAKAKLPQRMIRIGTSLQADASSIQAGVNMVPKGQTDRWTVLVEPGRYHERVLVENTLGPLTIMGLDQAVHVLITSGCTFGGRQSDGFGAQKGTGKPGCMPCRPLSDEALGFSQTLLVKSNDFVAVNLSIANNACGYDHKKARQSLAVQLLGDRGIFAGCRFLGAQDTLYIGPVQTRQYFFRSFINGTVDSIYGAGTAYFSECIVTVIYTVTAHQGGENTDQARSRSVMFFHNSSLLRPGPRERAAQDPSWRPFLKKGSFLGRPWGKLAYVVFMHTYMDVHIAKKGWDDWEKKCNKVGYTCRSKSSCWCQNVMFREYESQGPGASTDRIGWTGQLSHAEAASLTQDSILRGWLPSVPRESIGRSAPSF